MYLFVCISYWIKYIQNNQRKTKAAKEHTLLKVVTKQRKWKVNRYISDDKEIPKRNKLKEEVSPCVLLTAVHFCNTCLSNELFDTFSEQYILFFSL